MEPPTTKTPKRSTLLTALSVLIFIGVDILIIIAITAWWPMTVNDGIQWMSVLFIAGMVGAWFCLWGSLQMGKRNMKKTVIKFGLISGSISSIVLFIPIFFGDKSNYYEEGIMPISYTTIVLSFVLVFFGIRSYREKQGGGTITFVKAFSAGILITLISSIVYVIAWEIIYFNLRPDFWQTYTTAVIDHMKNNGATQQALDTTAKEIISTKETFDNPLINAAFTFLAPFPVGFIITLISAAILRKKAVPATV